MSGVVRAAFAHLLQKHRTMDPVGSRGALENSSWHESPYSYRWHWPLRSGPLSDFKDKDMEG